MCVNSGLKATKIIDQYGVYFLTCYRPGISFLDKFGQFGPKIQNCQFKLKSGTLTNLNMQNLMVVFTFSAFYQK